MKAGAAAKLPDTCDAGACVFMQSLQQLVLREREEVTNVPFEFACLFSCRWFKLTLLFVCLLNTLHCFVT